MQSSKNTYATIWTGAYLRTTSGTSTANKTLKIGDNLAGSSLPPPKEFSASNYYSSRKFLFNYHCQKTDTDTDERESHRESERRGGVRGKGGKRARILRYIPCAISSRVSVSCCRNRTKASLHQYFERRRSRSEVPLLRPLGFAVVISCSSAGMTRS